MASPAAARGLHLVDPPCEQAWAESPPAHLRYRHRLRLGRSLLELWQKREIVWTLAERDLRVRYKEATLGLAWAFLSPLALLVVFTLVFSRVRAFHSGPVPYPLFAYAGLLAWTFFSASVSNGANSILANKTLLNKVHFPRETFPLASLCVAGVDTLLACVAMAVLFGITGWGPRAAGVWVLAIAPVEVAFAAGVSLALSAVLVYMRDMTILLPILLQLGLFASPVAWPFAQIPTSLQPAYALLNPLGPVIDSVRRTLLLGQAPDPLLLGLAAAGALSFLAGGYVLFKRAEVGFADTV